MGRDRSRGHVVGHFSFGTSSVVCVVISMWLILYSCVKLLYYRSYSLATGTSITNTIPDTLSSLAGVPFEHVPEVVSVLKKKKVVFVCEVVVVFSSKIIGSMIFGSSFFRVSINSFLVVFCHGQDRTVSFL